MTNRRLLPTLVGWFFALAATAQAQPDTIYHLMRRITPGFNYAEYQAAVAMGFDTYLATQLNYTALTDVEAEVAEVWPTVYWHPYNINAEYGGTALEQSEPARQLRIAATYRAVFSEQRLFERMAEFWTDHLNVDSTKGKGFALVPTFQRSVVRKHALDCFRPMLLASNGQSADLSAAMLEYLDNTQSRCDGTNVVNENLGREILELHVLGTEEGDEYTEADVLALSRMISGWWRWNNANNPNFGEARYVKDYNCATQETFLGAALAGDSTSPSQGIAALNHAINYVHLTHGAVCKRFIARKMASWLLTDAPGTTHQTLFNQAVTDGANAFGLDGDIRAMIDAILTPARVDAIAGDVLAQKYMRPAQFVWSLLHATDAQFVTADEGGRSIDAELIALGQKVFHFGPPIGFPDSIGAWVQDQPGRWDFALRLFTGGVLAVNVDVDALYNQHGGFNVATAGQQVSLILAAGNLDPADVAEIQEYVIAKQNHALVKEKALALGAMAPSYSRY